MIKDRMVEFLAHLGMGQNKFEKSVGLSTGFVSNIGDSIRRKSLDKILAVYPELNVNWLLTGEGKMLKNSIQDISTDRQEVTLVPLLPVSAQGGRLNDFVVSVRKEDCEKLISPIKDADFAIMISGDSMAPEYPSGSKVLVKK